MQWDEKDRLQWDYPSIADTMRRYMKVADIREFFKRMVFNILVRNTDDHPRNHGFLLHGEKIELSPAYDIVPSITRPGVGTEFHLAMSVGDEGRKGTIQNALSRCARFGISKEDAVHIIEKIRKIVTDWQKHFKEQGVSEHDLNMLVPSFGKSDEIYLKLYRS